MRIVAGDWRGRTLSPLGRGDPAARLRPTPDRVRESLFNMLCQGRHGDAVTGAQVLDLFAGTGALGLEALSRGATAAVFVEKARSGRALLDANIRLLGCADRATVLARDATQALPPGPAATLVFLDPPYGRDLGARALAGARMGDRIAPGALIVWEENAEQGAPEGFTALDTRRYGDTTLTLLRAL